MEFYIYIRKNKMLMNKYIYCIFFHMPNIKNVEIKIKIRYYTKYTKKGGIF